MNPIQSSVCKNGTQLHYIPVDHTKQAEVRLLFAAGFQYFSAEQYHIPHLLEHLLLSGGGQPGMEDKLMEALQQLGAVANASTDNEHVTVMVSGPASTIGQALQLVLDSVYSLVLSDEVFDKERQIVIREIYEQHDSIEMAATNYLLYKVNPSIYFEAWVDQVAAAEKITAPEVVKAYQSIICPNNAVAIASGPKEDTVRKTILNALEKPKKNTTFTLPAIKLCAEHESQIEPLHLDLGESGGIVLLYKSAINAHSSALERIASNLGTLLLFDMPTSKLPKYLRDDGHTYSLSASPLYFKDTMYVGVTVMTAAARTHETLVTIAQYLQKYALQLFGADELESAKKFIMTSIETSTDTPSDMIDWYMGDIIYGRKPSTPENEVKLIAKMTAKQVAEAIRTIYVEGAYVGVVTAQDAAFWVADAAAYIESVRKATNEDELTRACSDARNELSLKRQAAPEFYGYGWAVYFWIAYASLLIGVFVPYLQTVQGHALVAIKDCSGGALVLGIAYVLTLAAAGALGYVNGARSKLAMRGAIGLYGIGALLYALLFFCYTTGFSGIGFAHPLSLLGIVPIVYALLSTVASTVLITTLLRSLKK